MIQVHHATRITFKPGSGAYLASDSPTAPIAVVFEDDQTTGYIYILVHVESDVNPIQESLWLYNANQISDSHLDSECAIAWSEDGLKAMVLINQYPWAAINFETQEAVSRYGQAHQAWDDRVLAWFK